MGAFNSETPKSGAEQTPAKETAQADIARMATATDDEGEGRNIDTKLEATRAL